MLLNMRDRAAKAARRGVMLAILSLASFTMASAADEESLPGMRRSTLLVSDIEMSVSFYEAIGFKVWYQGSSEAEPGKTIDSPLPLRQEAQGSRMVIMRGADPWLGMIGLLNYEAARKDQERERDGRIWHGDAVLMIEVTDLDSVAQRLKTAKAEILRDITPFSVRGADGQTINSKNLFVADPDGTVIELAERWQ